MKSIKEIMRKPRQHWVGNGFHVFPVFADKAFTNELSPFLMFDYAAPKSFEPNPGKPRGVGQHPHRGFETVTIAFQGEVEHGDNQGNSGVIGSGEVQWMTAARGIVHEEYHSKKFSKAGGMFEMVQLWVNLPAKDKMSPPAYQPILKDQITESPLYVHDPSGKACAAAPASAGKVRIIAGEFKGVKGPATTHTPVDMWDIHIAAGGDSYEFDITEGHNVIAFVREGRIEIQGKAMGPQDTAIMNKDATKLCIKAIEPSKILILAGEPIDEPIAARGPFVMNTDREIMQANEDFYSGNF
jgi:redox-sensitive bicupin YhaK (pirin superfamily)